MFDFYEGLRRQMIDTLQRSLRQIRQMMQFGVQEFADIVGITRQTVNNLESGKNQMSPIQYVAICAVIDHCLRDKPEQMALLSGVLCSNDKSGSKIFETIESGSLLRKWFLCFPDEARVTGFSHVTSPDVSYEAFEQIADSYKVFFDETPLYVKGFSDALDVMMAAMKRNGNQFIVPYLVIENVQRRMLNSDGEAVTMAQGAMQCLLKLQTEDLMKVRGSKDDAFLDNTLMTVFSKYKYVNRIALITQDKILAKNILSLNKDNVGGFQILALYYKPEKGVFKWDFDDEPDKVSINSESLSGWDSMN